MPYIRNITNHHIRVGRGENAVSLEPEVIVKSINPQTRERDSRPGENVAELSSRLLSSPDIKKSEDILFEVIDQETFEARQSVIHSGHMEVAEKPKTVPGFNGEDIPVEKTVVHEDVITIPMDPKTLEVYAGAESGVTGRKDPLAGKKLSDQKEGVRRSEDAQGVGLDPSVAAKMGQGA